MLLAYTTGAKALHHAVHGLAPFDLAIFLPPGSLMMKVEVPYGDASPSHHEYEQFLRHIRERTASATDGLRHTQLQYNALFDARMHPVTVAYEGDPVYLWRETTEDEDGTDVRHRHKLQARADGPYPGDVPSAIPSGSCATVRLIRAPYRR